MAGGVSGRVRIFRLLPARHDLARSGLRPPGPQRRLLRKEFVPDQHQFPAEEEDDDSQVISIGPEDNIAGLMEMLTYLVMLDDNTAAAMCEIIRNPNFSQA